MKLWLDTTTPRYDDGNQIYHPKQDQPQVRRSDRCQLRRGGAWKSEGLKAAHEGL